LFDIPLDRLKLYCNHHAEQRAAADDPKFVPRQTGTINNHAIFTHNGTGA
jgi:hypothetical protein